MEDNNGRIKNINIGSLTIIKVIAIIFILYFLYLIRHTLAILFIAILLSSAIDPWLVWLNKKKIPRTLGVLLIYTVGLAFLGLIIYLIIPPIILQVEDLKNNFPFYLDKIFSGFSALRNYAEQHGILDNIKQGLSSSKFNWQNTAGGLFSTVYGIFGGIFSFVLVMVITFYMASEEHAMKKIIWSIAPIEHQPYILKLLNRMQLKIGLWLRGQLILSLIIFSLAFLGLSILGVKYALVLALIAGLTEFVPYLGPMIAAVPAIFLAFAQSPMLALFVLGLFYVIHLVESNIIMPKLMQRVVGLNPIVIIIVLLVGFQLAGIFGAILSIPLATLVSEFLKDFFERKNNN